MDESPSDDTLGKLRAGFIQGLPKRRDAITGLMSILVPGASPEEVQLLRNEVHKLVSISGIHGFSELSDCARSWERSLTERYMSGQAVEKNDLQRWTGLQATVNRTIDKVLQSPS